MSCMKFQHSFVLAVSPVLGNRDWLLPSFACTLKVCVDLLCVSYEVLLLLSAHV